MAPPDRKMTLTAELVARVERTEPDPGPEPGTREHTDSEYDDFVEGLLAEHNAEPLWIFAYGSLIWNPVLETVEKRRAVAAGWHRSFCLRMARWRGTHELPCLMMALDRGGSCSGLVYRLPDGQKRGQMKRLLLRELDDMPASNVPRWITVATENGPVRALAFVAAPNGRSYAGKLPHGEVARVLARAAGDLGSAAQYLYRTVTMLEEHGIHDRNLWQIQDLVAREIEGAG